MPNYNGSMIRKSTTITETAGADIADVRGKILKYDDNGDVILAATGTDIPVGVATMEDGYNDITGAESGKVAKGDDVDIQIKDIGFVLAGGDIKKGTEVAAGADGKAVAAAAGNYVLGIALTSGSADGLVQIAIAKYQKNGGTQ